MVSADVYRRRPIAALAASGLQQRALWLGQSVRRVVLRRGPVKPETRLTRNYNEILVMIRLVILKKKDRGGARLLLPVDNHRHQGGGPVNNPAGASTGSKRRRRSTVSVMGAVGVAVLLAACSSSSKSSSTATTASSGGSSATTAAGGSATTGSGGSSGSSSGSGLAAAQAYVAKASVRPTQITDTAKVTGKIPSGKTIYFIPCGNNPECQQEGQIVEDATSVLGWSTVILPNDGSPQQSKAAFDQVVRAKRAGVLYTAIPQATFQSGFRPSRPMARSCRRAV